MKSTAPKELGILFIAAVFGIIGGGVALVMYEVSFVLALLVAGIVATVTALALWLGWREPVARDLTPRDVRPTAGPSAQAMDAPAAPTAGRAAPAQDATPTDTTARHAAAAAEPGTAAPQSAPSVEPTARARAEDTTDHGSSDTPPPGGPAASTDEATANTGIVRSSTLLPGQQELASRKGEWKYDAKPAEPASGSATAGATGASEADATEGGAESAPDATAAPGADGASAADAQPGASGSSVATPSGASVPIMTDSAGDTTPGDADKPATLTAAREGGPDNLKEIKGVGPKLEVMLNEMGIYHFDQIAGWSDRELAWVDDNLNGFKGRASRDEWVSQAKVLASGGDTDFSNRVDSGDVY